MTIDINEDLKKEFALETVEDDAKGLQDYWLKVFQNCGILREEIVEADFPILKSLISIQKVSEEKGKNYTLIYTFKVVSIYYRKTSISATQFYRKSFTFQRITSKLRTTVKEL